jgi:hypothetical protein
MRLPIHSLVPRTFVAIAVIACLFVTTARPSHAVVLHTGNGNTTAPGDDPGFNYVGISSTGGASFVYLGNQYAISANHVNISGSVQLRPTGGAFQSFTVDPNAFGVGIATKQLKSSDNSNADLKLFRLTTDPGLVPLSIISTAPTSGQDVVMIGNGLSHGTDRQWNVTAGPTWNEVPPNPGPPNVAGFDVVVPRVIRWGLNEIDQTGLFTNLGGGAGTLDYFTTEFNDPTFFPGTDTLFGADEAQAVNGDSGGAIFSKIAGNWYLAGLINAEGKFEQQPSNTSVFGNASILADLSQYRSQIIAAIPEPGTLTIALSGAIVMAVLGRRQRPQKRFTA